ncbi:TonB-dependent receptor [Sphingobacterium allocomposti]|uniref:TonB-dependent receptor n=1 Tax=Sphingobacterium allocomposti TaxID=415956 RepID=A0A5S5D634_9SPHI|nr:TonB-dependent receptor [Sphingobacterium composti Yoo et al. 2007 non Ten et al. 2007]TYP91513.1 TonB-dependent receptor [Sphingobacterium composti Yoo et al. 2007 non Ten et al. 2007]HLS94200.1 TonB-dependent receptor [Sphingobacterium sp.]
MKLIYTILLLLCCSASYAQTTILKGKVMDASDRFSLPGATLRLEQGNRHTVSNVTGDFEFLNLPAGTYTLSVNYMGYQTYTMQISVNGKQEQLEVLLSPSTQTIGEVSVMGDIAKGQARALNQQKNNGNITNIISSDQVGRFPDQNIGDALKRVPGITMQNDQGEARNIIIRGLSPELNSVTLNGDRIPSAEGDNRNVQMDLIPSDMISTIEVNKTLTPDMDADAIGGSVNLITRAVPNKQRISATLGGGYMPIREQGIYNGSLVYGNRFADNKLGVVLSGTIQTQNFGSDNIEAVWEEDGGRTFVEEMDIRKYDVQRIRRSFSLATDYAFNSRHRLELNAIYNWRDDRENRYRARYRGIEWNEDEQAYVGDIRRQTKGGIGDNSNKNTRLERQKVLNFSLRGEHLLSPKLDMDWAASYSKASEDRPNERYIEYDQGDVVLNQDLSDPRKPFITDTYHDYSQFGFRELTDNQDYTEEDEFGAKINFRVPLSVIADQKGRFRFGARIRLKNKKRDNIFYSYTPTEDFGGMNTLPMEDWSNLTFAQGNQYNPGAFVDKKYLGGLDLNNTSLFEQETVPDEYLAENYHAKEQIYAGYVRWDQNFTEKTSMIVGARVEYTKIDYTGNYVQDEEELLGQINNKNDYINVLPSLTLRHDVTKDFIIRAAVTTSLARPNYYALAPFVSSMPGDFEIVAGNPDLKATYATNFDLMLENYFQNIGLVSGGLFYKNLSNFIYTYNDPNYSHEKFAADFPNVSNPIPAGSSGQWSFVQHRNGDKVDVYGAEVAFQRQLDFLPGKFLKGFGIYANYTYTHSVAKGITSEDGDEREGLGLPKTAPHMLNGSLSWENSKFSARVSANYTAAYLDEITESSFYDAYYDRQFFLDANASYKITKQFRIFGEANNLTNQPLRYYQGSKERTMQLEYYRPRFNLGVKFDL